ncbi:GLIPR1-like protein 1 [Brachyistius frenatus]|uniref:GLIPR1-like protein 1 n=1 Tax=Brachyistius frenatus TaxID=100188 RepID=UPI0037E83ABE
MGSVAERILWVWIIVDSAVCSVSLPDISDRKFVDECVQEHNRARSAVSPTASNMLSMTWDEGLAITARAWARKCVFEHNIHLKDVRRVHPTFPSVGENIWAGSQAFSATAAIELWVNEEQNYNYRKNACTHACGHYTQVVWASSYKVGCAVQLCKDGVSGLGTSEMAIFVCNYATAGNMNGAQPYESAGAACSGCKGTCVDKLCWNQERDSEKSYDWTPDWDTAPSGGSNCAPILVIRPVALLLTFLAAYAVRYFYPDVFCYE